MKNPRHAACRLLAILLAACLLPLAVFLANGVDHEHHAAAAFVQADGAHRIGVRTLNGVGEFFDRQNGLRFTPRGNNYVRLQTRQDASGKTQVEHATFIQGAYDAQRAEEALTRMRRDGYNTVRVFLNENALGDAQGRLSGAYLANVSDFLARAKRHGMYVILTGDWLPQGDYARALNAECCATFGLHNLHYLSRAGIEANRLYFRDLVQGLKKAGAPLETIFAYELRNEFFFDPDYPPLSFSSGVVYAGDGRSYDMSVPEQKHSMLENNLVFWINTMRGAIRQEDPEALVTVGFFSPALPNPARMDDQRLALVYPALRSQADFIDVHIYPGIDLDMRRYMENFNLGSAREKPVIMGEFGALKQRSDIDSAVLTLKDWQIASCEYGIDGWLLWTWDTQEQKEFYTATEDKGQIEKAFAPVTRPDPCAASVRQGR